MRHEAPPPSTYLPGSDEGCSCRGRPSSLQVAPDSADFPLQQLAGDGSPSQERLLALKPQAWGKVIRFLLALVSASVVIYCVLSCHYLLCDQINPPKCHKNLSERPWCRKEFSPGALAGTRKIAMSTRKRWEAKSFLCRVGLRGCDCSV